MAVGALAFGGSPTTGEGMGPATKSRRYGTGVLFVSGVEKEKRDMEKGFGRDSSGSGAEPFAPPDDTIPRVND